MADESAREKELLAELKKRGRTDLIAQIEQRRADLAVPEPPTMAEAAQPSLGTQALTAAASLSAGAPGAVNFAKNAALPTAGNAAGTLLGGAMALHPLTRPFAPYATPLLEAAGSFAGMKGNEAAGISGPPSPGEVALGVGGPLAVRAGAAIKAGASKFGTPGMATSTLNELAPDEAARQLGKLPRPAPSSQELFDQLAGSQMTIDATPWKNEAQALLAKESKLAGKNPDVVNYLTRLTKKFDKNGNALNVSDFHDELVRLGRKAGQPGDAQGVYKDLFKFASESMDGAVKAAEAAAPGSAGVQAGASALVAARQAYKREQVFTELDDAIDHAFKLQGKGGSARQFNAKEVVTAIEKNPFFAQAFSQQEQDTVKNLFYTLNEIPALKPGAGVNAGSLRAFTRTLFPMTAGSGVGLAVSGGNPAAASIGAAAGALIPPAMEVRGLIKLALRTEVGREMLQDLLSQSQGKLTTQVLTKLSAALSAQMAPQPQSVVPPSLSGMPNMNQQPMGVVP